MVDNPQYLGLEEQYFQGEKIYNYGGFVPQIVVQPTQPPSSPTPTPSFTPTQTPTFTPTNTPTYTPTNTPSPSATPPSLYDADYQAILDYATLQGYTLPSDGQKTLQNQLVVDLKTGGIWTDLDIFYVFATDGDDDFSLINWKSPGNFTPSVNGVSVIRTSNQGWTAQGSSGYLNTTFIPSTNSSAYTLNDASVLYWDYDNDTTFAAVAYFGQVVNTGSLIRGNGTNTTAHRVNSNAGITPSYDMTGIGLKFFQRDTSTNLNLYNATATPTSFAQVSTSLETNPITILRYGSGAANQSSNICSMFGMGAALTGMETDLFNACDTYMTSI